LQYGNKGKNRKQNQGFEAGKSYVAKGFGIYI